MMSSDYTQQIGNRSVSPRVPLPIALAVLVIAAAALWFGVSRVRAIPSAARAEMAAPSAQE